MAEMMTDKLNAALDAEKALATANEKMSIELDELRQKNAALAQLVDEVTEQHEDEMAVMESDLELAKAAALPAKGTPRLNAALAKAQAEMDAALKDAVNPAFKGEGKPKGTSYATLAACWAAWRAAGPKHGLALLQEPYNPETKGMVGLRTTLAHESGEERVSTLEFPVAGGTAQNMIAALTYLRRAMMSSVLGIATEDDDGNAASGTVVPQQGRIAQAIANAAGAQSIVAAKREVDTSRDWVAELRSAATMPTLKSIGGDIARAVAAKKLDTALHAACKSAYAQRLAELVKMGDSAPEPGSEG